eukprot:6214593-Pleurochrysis_carterae.AAC.9
MLCYFVKSSEDFNNSYCKFRSRLNSSSLVLSQQRQSSCGRRYHSSSVLHDSLPKVYKVLLASPRWKCIAAASTAPITITTSI